MRLPPLNVIASWPAPCTTHCVTRGNALLIVNIIFVSLVVIAVLARFYARVFMRRTIGKDDVMIAFAFVFTLGMTAVVLLANRKYGWDRHLYDIPEFPGTEIQTANIIAFVAKIMFTLAATFTRLSLICFYFRLVKDSRKKWFNRVLHASLLWTVAVCIAFVALVIWQCTPVDYYWVFPPTGNGYCLDEGKVTLAAGVINCVSDLLCTVLPIPIIMRLQMPLKQRIGVCLLLCLGFIVTIAGVIRTYFIWKSLMDSWDETWYTYPLWIAAAVEIDLAVICACAPALKTLLAQPIATVSSRVSSKISLLLSPKGTSNGSKSSKNSLATSKSSWFDPLRSLPWFQLSRWDFEKTGHSQDRSHIDLEDVAISHQAKSGPATQVRELRDPITNTGDHAIRPADVDVDTIKRRSADVSS